MKTNPEYVYFIGIGGIGMSAVARYYRHNGCTVSGYDRTPSRLTAALESEGIAVHYEDRPDLLPQDRENTLVIYTPAVPESLGELRTARSEGYRLIKRSQALGAIASAQKTLAVAGTHGKTTTSTLLAHLLTVSGAGCSAFLGGISKNYRTNLLLSRNPVLVAEADEFDRSFLQLFPSIAAITSADADHLDIYGDLGHVREAFRLFAGQVSDYLVLKDGVDLGAPDDAFKARIYRYAYGRRTDFYADRPELLPGGYFRFTLQTPSGPVPDCRVGIPGWVNVENAVAAAAVALLHGTDKDAVREGLRTFQGVERRFDIRLNTPRCAYVDDYAHHPKEIAAALTSIRNIFPGRRLTAVFQPHLYTRTRDFYREFAASLDLADEVFLLPVYPARELPIPGIGPELILQEMKSARAEIVPKEELTGRIARADTDILVTLGAGDIDRLAGPLTDTLTEKYLK